MDKDNKNSKGICRSLKSQFYAYIAIAVAAVAIGETCPQCRADIGTQTLYICTTIMELLTICLIPVALKLMKLAVISKRIRQRGNKGYLAAASARLAILGVPMAANAVLYSLCKAVPFAYLAIIGAISLAFVYPAEGRYTNETSDEKND